VTDIQKHLVGGGCGEDADIFHVDVWPFSVSPESTDSLHTLVGDDDVAKPISSGATTNSTLPVALRSTSPAPFGSKFLYFFEIL
jgi:hypothetical protein